MVAFRVCMLLLEGNGMGLAVEWDGASRGMGWG